MDGLSLNNLALNRDNTSKENAINSENLANSRSAGDNSIDQLEKKGEIEGGDHENTSASGGFSENLTEDEFNDGYESEDEEEEIYDEYTFKMVDDATIAVIDNEVGVQIASISPEKLSKFISNMKQVSGIIVNKRV